MLKEGSFELTAQQTAFRYNGQATKMIDVRVPLRRQLEFGTNAGADAPFPEENLYFVWWYCATIDEQTGKQFAGASARLNCFGENQVFFTNSRLYN